MTLVHRIAVLGNICNYGYKYATAFRKKGINIHLIISKKELLSSNLLERISELNGGLPEWIKVYDNSLEADKFYARILSLALKFKILRLIFLLRSFDFIFAITTDSSYYAQFSGRPYILHAIGSDIRELWESRDAKIRQGYLTIRSIKKARLVYIAFDRIFFEKIKRLGIKNTKFLYMPIDTDKFKPLSTQGKQENTLLFLHPTILDWTRKGTKKHGFKGNDRFLRAFARFLKEGVNARLIMPDRGPDKEETKQLVRELGIEKYIEFYRPMPEDELIELYQKCDVVVDQFEIGSFGVITLEAMSCAKPVIVYVDEECCKKAYAQLPPILNARSEDEIYGALVKSQNAELRNSMGAQARQWILENHASDRVVNSLASDIAAVLNRGKIR